MERFIKNHGRFRFCKFILYLIVISKIALAQEGLWTSAEELAALPTSGPAWEAVQTAADDARPNKATVDDKDSDNNVQILAAAIVYARTGEQHYKEKVTEALEELIREGKPKGRTLEWAREAGAYALAADLIGHRSYAFDRWCEKIARHWEAKDDKTMMEMFKQRPNNWGSMAFGSLTALYAYLGDRERLETVRNHWIQLVEGPKPQETEYDEDDMSWHYDKDDPRIINPIGAVKNGMNIDGVIPDDLRRGGSFREPPRDTGYPWEHMQGIIMAARILERAGLPIWDAGDYAILRAAYCLQVRFENDYGDWAAEEDDEWMIPFLDAAYDTNWMEDYHQSESLIWQHGKNIGWAYVALGELGNNNNPTYELDFSVSGSGSIEFDPPGEEYTAGTHVEITAVPDSGWQFVRWESDLTGSGNPATLIMSTNKTIRAVFTEISSVFYTVSIEINGNGDVLLDPPPVIEHSNSAWYPEGAVVTLTSVPRDHWIFAGWEGDLSGQENPVAITIDSHVNLQANFREIAPNPGGLVELQEVQTGATSNANYIQTSETVAAVSGNLYLAAITTKNFTPVNSVHGLGLNWERVKSQCGGRSQTGIEVWMANGNPDRKEVVTAVLVEPVNNAAMVVTRYTGVDLEQPIATIISENTNGLNGDCLGGQDGAAYSLDLAAHSSGSLLYGAIAHRHKKHRPGGNFETIAEVQQGIGGNVAGITVQTHSASLPSPAVFQGEFSGDVDWAVIGLEILPGIIDIKKYTLVADTVGSGTVSISPSGSEFPEGSTVTLTATPRAGWQFERWVGDINSTNNQVELIMDSDKVTAAVFTPLPPASYTLNVEVSGQGAVTLSPPNGVYLEGTEVNILATPAAGHNFLGWGGDHIASENPIAIIMDTSKNVTAYFGPADNDEVKYVDIQSGGSTNSTFVSIEEPIFGFDGDLYLAAISTKKYRETTAITGLGLTWHRVIAQCSGRAQTGIEIWMAQGTPNEDGMVTAAFASTTQSAFIAVSRYTGVHISDPVSVLISGNTNGVDGDCINGRDSRVYNFPTQTREDNVMVFAAIAKRHKSHSAAGGFVERIESSAGAGGAAAGIVVMDRYVQTASDINISGSFNSNVDWVMAAVEIHSVSHEEQSLGSAQYNDPVESDAINGQIPQEIVLNENYPNPFNPETTIEFALPKAMPVSLIVYNALGQQVRRLVDGTKSAGYHHTVWDGKTDKGRKASSGIYFMRLVAGQQNFVRRMILQK